MSAATSQLKPLMTLNVALNHAIQFLHPGPDRQRDSVGLRDVVAEGHLDTSAVMTKISHQS